MKKYTTLFFLFVMFHGHVMAQVLISWNSTMPAHFMLDDLWNISIDKTTSVAQSSILELKIETQQHIGVITITTDPFVLNQGINFLSEIRSRVKSIVSYGNNSYSSVLLQTGTLPLGEYIFCATLTSPVDHSIQGLSCEERDLAGSSPPYLISPENGEVINNVHPLLTWHPPFPVDESKISYSLVLAPISEHQLPEQAIKNNVPFVNQKDVSEKFLNYSSIYPPLENGKLYAWKVDVFFDHQFFGATPVWSFKVLDKQFNVNTESSGCYSLINDQAEGGYYLAGNFLRIGYNNKAGDKELKYRIVQADSRKIIEFNQKIELQNGMNKVDFDMENGHFSENTPYELQIEDRNRNRFKTIFYYQKPTN